MGEWISCETGLPEDDKPVLCYIAGTYPVTATFDNNKLWRICGANYSHYGITHWQELPPPPELWWICKNCGENERPRCPKCTREDGLMVTDELIGEEDGR